MRNSDVSEPVEDSNIDIRHVESLLSSLVVSENPSKNARKRTRQDFEGSLADDEGENRDSLESGQAQRLVRVAPVRRRRIIISD